MAINIPIFSSLDTKGFDRAKKEFQSLEGFGQKAGYIIKNAFLPLAAAGAGVAAFGYKAALSASDLNEELSKSQQIFGQASKGIEQFADTAARTLGQSKQEAVAAASTFGIMGKAAGLTGAELAGFSTRLVTLTSDLASFNNAQPADVVNALGAALRGESEPMRRFGVLLNDAALKAEAMAMGIYNGKGPLEQQAKILAANSLILKQTTDAQGDFARTSDGAANQQRILNASMKDLTAEIGRAFLPALQNILRFTASIPLAFSEDGVGGAIREFRKQLQGITRDSDGTINGFGKFVNALITVRNALAHVLNMFIRLYNVLPFLDNIDTIDMVDQLTTNFNDLYGALSKTTIELEKQKQLKGFMGPVASRDVQELADHMAAYKEQLRFATGNTDDLEQATTKAGGAMKKKTAAVREQAKAVKDDLAKAYEAAVDALKDRFTPALKDANDKLTAAQDIYNDFYKSIRDSIMQIGDLGTAWREAADSEGAKTFFGVLKDQSDKANKLANNLRLLITRGLDDPTLIQAILNAGADTGLEITKAIIDGGDEGLASLKNWAKSINQAADDLAKLTADKWFKSGVDQAQAVVNGINSVIADTEFALKFTVDVSGVQALTDMFGSNVAAVNAGQTPAPMFNPADFSAAAFMALGAPANAGAVRTSSVNINVNGGDPNAVVSALRNYMRQNGSVPVKIGNQY